MRALAFFLIGFHLAGCAAIAQRPALRTGLMVAGGVLVAGAVAQRVERMQSPPVPLGAGACGIRCY